MTYFLIRYALPVLCLYLLIVTVGVFILTYWQWFLAGFVVLALLALLSANSRKKDEDVWL